MQNKVADEGAEPNHPSTPTSQDLNQHNRQREPDSNQPQSNQRRRTDETPPVDSNSSSMIEEIYGMLRMEQAFLRMGRQTKEDAPAPLDNANDETAEESLASTEGNTNSQDNRNQQGSSTVIIVMLFSNTGLTNIDGRSFEELVELQERIGKVERGLSKETISSHLKTRVHTTPSVDSAEKETVICTICQDAYENKDKIATLDCQHEYHEDCITQWLVLKNVCPICKRQGLKTMEEDKV